MRKIIIFILCCGVLVSMVGCGGNTAPPHTVSLSTMVSETVTTDTPIETPLTTAVEPTEKGKESTTTESKSQTTEPTEVLTSNGVKRNSNLLYTILPIERAKSLYFEQQLQRAVCQQAHEKAIRKLERYDRKINQEAI